MQHLLWEPDDVEFTFSDADLNKSAETPALAAIHHPLGTHGLWHDRSAQLPAYIQNIAHAMIKDGHDESSAIALAIGAVKRWAAGEGKVTPEVQAAATAALAEWEKLKAEHSKTKVVEPDVTKDSFEGHHIAGTPDTYKHGWIKIGVGVDSSHLSLKKNGDVVHKPTGTVIGHVDKKTDFPTKGTSTFVTSHANGKQVYNGVYKKDAMAAVARYHNHAAASDAHAAEITPVTHGPILPAGSVPIMSGTHVTGYKDPDGNWYDDKGHLTAAAPKKPEAPHTTKPKPDLIPGTNVPKALTGGAAYQHAKDSQGHLNPSQLQALSEYGQPHGYKIVNPFLNKDGMVYHANVGTYLPATDGEKAKAKAMIKQLDSAVAAAKPTTQDLVVHRRLGNSINDLIGPPGSHVGKTFTNKAYVSTTTAASAIPGNGYGYESKKTLMDIQVPKGSKVLMGQAAEKEVILPRGAKFTVVHDEVEPDGTRHVKVLYHPDQTPASSLPKTEPVAKPAVEPAHVPAAVTSVPGSGSKPEGTMTLKKPGSSDVKGYYHLENHTVHDANGNVIGTSPSKLGALYLASGDHDKANEMGAHATVTAPSVSVPAASDVSDEALAKQLSDHAIAMEDTMESSPQLTQAVTHAVQAAGSLSTGFKTAALYHIGMAQHHLKFHAQDHPDDADSVDSYQHHLSQIKSKIDGSDPTEAPSALAAPSGTGTQPKHLASMNELQHVADSIGKDLTPGGTAEDAQADLDSATTHLKNGNEAKALAAIENAKASLNAHGSIYSDAAGKTQQMTAALDSISAKIKGELPSSASPTGANTAAAKVKNIAKKIKDLDDSSHSSKAYDSSFNAWDSLKKGDVKGAIQHLDEAQTHLANHVSEHPADFVKSAEIHQSLNNIKSSLGSNHASTSLTEAISSKPVAETSAPIHVPTGPMIDSTDLSMKTNGDVVHKQTKQVIGHVEKQKDFPAKGTTTFTVTHADGTKVYTGPYKGKSLAALAQHHNTKGGIPVTSTSSASNSATSIDHANVAVSLGHLADQASQLPALGSKQSSVKNYLSDAVDALSTKNGHVPNLDAANANLHYAQNDIVEAAVGKNTEDFTNLMNLHNQISGHIKTLEKPVMGPNGYPLGHKPVYDPKFSTNVIGSYDPKTGNVYDTHLANVGTASGAGTAYQKLKDTAPPTTGWHGKIKLRPGEAAGVSGVRAAIKHPDLTSAEHAAAKLYSGSDYTTMNRYVANGDKFEDHSYLSTDEKKLISSSVKDLKAAINRSVVEKPVAVNRRISSHGANQTFGPMGSHVGKSYKENRFVSTTTSSNALGGFGEVEIHYHLQPGAKALDLNKHKASYHPNEKEILLGPGQTFKILNDVNISGVRTITVESQ